MTLPPVLRVDEVMARYGIRDERTARRLMNAAGGFKVGGRLVVREDDLGAHERRLAAPANPVRPVVHDAVKRPTRTSAPGGSSPADGPDWWRPDTGLGVLGR